MVLYGVDFEAKTDDQTYTLIYAVVNPMTESVDFNYDGKRYTRKLRRKGAYVGFIFKGWFFKVTSTELGRKIK